MTRLEGSRHICVHLIAVGNTKTTTGLVEPSKDLKHVRYINCLVVLSILTCITSRFACVRCNAERFPMRMILARGFSRETIEFLVGAM